MNPTRMHIAVLCVSAAVLLTACSSTNATVVTAETSTTPNTTTAPSISVVSSPGGGATDGTTSPVEAETISVASTPPDTIPAIPDGSYRLTLTQDDIIAGGSSDLSNVGTWTMTISKGNYQVACKWVDESGDDCGHSGRPDAVVEIGPVRGDETRAWFASDLEAVSKKNGCTPLPECGNPDPYSFAWTLQGSDLVFSDTVGFGANEGDVYEPWTFKPWAKIS